MFADVDLYKRSKQLLLWILTDDKAMHNDYNQNNKEKKPFSLSSTKTKPIIIQLHSRFLQWSHSFSIGGLSHQFTKTLFALIL